MFINLDKNSKTQGGNPYYAPGSINYTDPHNAALQAATILVGMVSEKTLGNQI